MTHQLSTEGIYTAAKAVIEIHELLQGGDAMWTKLRKELKADDVCVKPVGDGCSTGVARLRWVARAFTTERAFSVLVSISLSGFLTTLWSSLLMSL